MWIPSSISKWGFRCKVTYFSAVRKGGGPLWRFHLVHSFSAADEPGYCGDGDLDVGRGFGERVDGCAERYRHLRFDTKYDPAQCHLDGGSVQFFWCLCDDCSQCESCPDDGEDG